MADVLEPQSLLDMLQHPAFSVSDGIITAANRSAVQLDIRVNTPIANLLPTHKEDYEAFESGILYLTVNTCGADFDATVTRTPQGELFLLDTRFADASLEAMALASQYLRGQLSSVMSTAQGRLSRSDAPEDNSIVRGLYRMHRMLCNMSDIPYYRSKPQPTQMLELGSAVYEIVEKATTLLAEAGITVVYTGVREMIYTTGDYEMLERGIYNLLSNAAKFSAPGSKLQVSLTKKSKVALLTVEDIGRGISTDLYSTLFSRYQRGLSAYDGHEGIGLGMAMVQTVAAHHGGTVLVTQPASGGTRVTLSLAIRSPESTEVRSPTVTILDYAGGNDHALLELSDVLPAKLYRM